MKKNIIRISALFVLLTASVGFTKINNSEKISRDIEILCSRSWTPINQGQPTCDIKINFFPNNQYKLTSIDKPGTIVKGDSMLSGKWTIDQNEKIHIIIREFEKIGDIVHIDDKSLVLHIDNNYTIEYSATDVNENLETKNNN